MYLLFWQPQFIEGTQYSMQTQPKVGINRGGGHRDRCPQPYLSVRVRVCVCVLAFPADHFVRTYKIKIRPALRTGKNQELMAQLQFFFSSFITCQTDFGWLGGGVCFKHCCLSLRVTAFIPDYTNNFDSLKLERVCRLNCSFNMLLFLLLLLLLLLLSWTSNCFVKRNFIVQNISDPLP